MKVLFLNQFFWPDSSATSQLLTDLARGLVDRGHQVTVICADGGYAPADLGNPPAVRIERVKAHPFGRGKLGRLLSYLSFYLLAFVRAFTLPRQDLVVSLTTPPLISLVGTAVKLFCGSRHFIWEMDIYPDVAISLNYLKAGGLVDRLTGALADFSRRNADGILALGDCMKQRLVDRGIPATRIHIAENWADGAAITPQPRPGDPDRLVVLYSGNLGLAHDLDTIVGAIRNLRDDARFRFLFVGGGGRREELAAIRDAESLTAVDLLSYVSRASLSDGLALGDIGLVTQQDVCCGSVVPSKVYGILAAGRPILFVGPRAATPALTIERFGCGWHVDCGDIPALTTLLLHLAENPAEVQAAGRNARQALLAHFDLPIGVDRIAAILEKPFTGSAIAHTEEDLLPARTRFPSTAGAPLHAPEPHLRRQPCTPSQP